MAHQSHEADRLACSSVGAHPGAAAAAGRAARSSLPEHDSRRRQRKHQVYAQSNHQA